MACAARSMRLMMMMRMQCGRVRGVKTKKTLVELRIITRQDERMSVFVVCYFLYEILLTVHFS